MNLKFDEQRVGLDLCKNSLGAAYWARVSWLEHERRILKTHVLSLRPTVVRCGLSMLDNVLSKVKLKAWALCRLDRPDSPKSNEEICTKLLT
jgi:hypothetical protein